MAKGDAVIAVSKMIKTYILKNYKIAPNKIFLNYRGVDAKEFPYLFKPKYEWINIHYFSHFIKVLRIISSSKLILNSFFSLLYKFLTKLNRFLE